MKTAAQNITALSTKVFIRRMRHFERSYREKTFETVCIRREYRENEILDRIVNDCRDDHRIVIVSEQKFSHIVYY